MSTDYTKYIIEHVANVNKAYKWLVDHNIIEFKGEISNQLNLHDVSKHTGEEYNAYDAYFYGNKTDIIKNNFNYAWLHHIHNNPHHWQHWVLINDDDDEGTYALEMPENYVIEMICDWWAFSFKADNLFEIFSWYNTNKKNMIMHKNTVKYIEDILDKIKMILEDENNELS